MSNWSRLAISGLNGADRKHAVDVTMRWGLLGVPTQVGHSPAVARLEVGIGMRGGSGRAGIETRMSLHSVSKTRGARNGAQARPPDISACTKAADDASTTASRRR